MKIISKIMLMVSAIVFIGFTQVWAQTQNDRLVESVRISMKGRINHDHWVKGETAEVTFDHIPRSQEEFEDAQRILGKEPHGAIVLELMAMEMFRRDRKMGEACLRMTNTRTNFMSIHSRLKELFREGDGYARPYQVASFLKGASYDNGYNPTKPYTVKFRVSPNLTYQETYEGDPILFIDIRDYGRSSEWNRVYVTLNPDESEYYLVSNNPGMYSQCRKIARGVTWNGLK